MTSQVNKLADWTPNYHKILIFFPTKSLKRLRAARIDQLADSNEPAINSSIAFHWISFKMAHLCKSTCIDIYMYIYILHLGNLQTPFSNEIKVSVDSQGGYSLSVGSTTWLMNAPAFATAGGKTYSTDASATDKMVLKGTKTFIWT